MFVLQRSGAGEGVVGPVGNAGRLRARIRWQIDQFPAQVFGFKRGEFSVNWLGSGLQRSLSAFAPDIVHLHWINAGYVSLGEIESLDLPVVWTAHDMWPFTGGCHYDSGCGRYVGSHCVHCPLQTHGRAIEVASSRLKRKVSACEASDIAFVCPSRWLGDVARASPVGAGRQVDVIPNCIDLDRYRPIDRAAARDLFGLAHDEIIILFGALRSQSDPRKGFEQLDAALRSVAATWRGAKISLCVFGTAKRGISSLHGIPVRNMGHLHDDESLIALYSAADIFVAPSLQDNLPNTVLEAAACGLPTVAFNVGGMSDLIEHEATGWLAPAGDASSLADGISAFLASRAWRVRAGAAAREAAASRFSYKTVAASYLAVYERLLTHGKRGT